MFELEGRSNYIRATTLELLSPESLILVATVLVFLFLSRRRIVDLFVLSLPFTDQIYRIWLLQPTDVLALLLLVTHRRVPLTLKTPLLIVPLFVASSLYGYVHFSSSFGLLYTARFALVLLAINYVIEYIRADGADYFQRLYCKAIVLSVALQLLQLASWLLGLDTPGVFYLEGFPRIKGTAHEPATFGVLLALSLPFCLNLRARDDRHGLSLDVDKVTFAAIVIGMFFSVSVTGSITVILVSALSGALLLQYPAGRRAVLASAFVFLLALALVRLASERYFDYTVAKALAYPLELLGLSDANISGRASDRWLLDYFAQYQLLGIGAFNTTPLTWLVPELAAANVYLTFLLELGALMFAIFLLWLGLLIRMALTYRTVHSSIYVAAFLAWLVSLAGLRTFGFYLPWLLFIFAIEKMLTARDAAPLPAPVRRPQLRFGSQRA